MGSQIVNLHFRTKLFYFECLVFPPACSDFRGPHEEQCLSEIWLETGCLQRGLGFPGDLTETAFAVLAARTLT